MRISGSLFTFSELSASVADSTFTQKTGSVLIQSNECVTVESASALLNIGTIFGNSLRYPFYDELIPSASITGSVQTLTYSFSNEYRDSSIEFSLYVNDILVVASSSPISTTVISLNVGDRFSAYISLDEGGGIITCGGSYVQTIVVYLNSVFYGTYISCPFLTFGEINVTAGQNWEVFAITGAT